jgi:hypothetical protein
VGKAKQSKAKQSKAKQSVPTEGHRDVMAGTARKAPKPTSDLRPAFELKADR